DTLEVSHGEVVRRETTVSVVVHQAHAGEPTLDLLGAAVGRRVVDDHQVELVLGPLDAFEVLEAPDDVLATVVVEDDQAHLPAGRSPARHELNCSTSRRSGARKSSSSGTPERRRA